ncbi:unnamed protein product, partial [Pocillopora meandrina]
NPLDNSICHNLLEAARRDKPVSVKKAPISAEIIKSIIDKFAGPSASLKDVRVACICSLGYAGFFRYDELCNIAPEHLGFFPDHLRVFVPRAKNDIYLKLSYTRCREIFKECLKTIGVDHNLYGLHSLRSGGATSAVSCNPNLSERILKLHGRWKSDTAKDMYILEDVSKRLQVTSQLGL